MKNIMPRAIINKVFLLIKRYFRGHYYETYAHNMHFFLAKKITRPENQKMFFSIKLFVHFYDQLKNSITTHTFCELKKYLKIEPYHIDSVTIKKALIIYLFFRFNCLLVLFILLLFSRAWKVIFEFINLNLCCVLFLCFVFLHFKSRLFLNRKKLISTRKETFQKKKKWKPIYANSTYV